MIRYELMQWIQDQIGDDHNGIFLDITVDHWAENGHKPLHILEALAGLMRDNKLFYYDCQLYLSKVAADSARKANQEDVPPSDPYNLFPSF